MMTRIGGGLRVRPRSPVESAKAHGRAGGCYTFGAAGRRMYGHSRWHIGRCGNGTDTNHLTGREGDE